MPKLVEGLEAIITMIESDHPSAAALAAIVFNSIAQPQTLSEFANDPGSQIAVPSDVMEIWAGLNAGASVAQFGGAAQARIIAQGLLSQWWAP